MELLPNTDYQVQDSYNLQNKDDFEQFNLHSEKLRNSLLPDCVNKWNGLDKNEKETKVVIMRLKTV